MASLNRNCGPPLKAVKGWPSRVNETVIAGSPGAVRLISVMAEFGNTPV